jgi:hypothetical protein
MEQNASKKIVYTEKDFLTVAMVMGHKIHIYLEYLSVCPLVGMEPPPTLPQSSVLSPL